VRIRTIKPEWLSSQKLASASDAARLLSVALIVMADDHGRGRGSIAEIAMQVWRYEMTREDGAKVRETLAKVRETLAELSATGFVKLYQVDGNDYFELPAWSEHQRVDKPGKAKIPGPYATSENIRETLAKVPGSLATDQGSGIRDQGDDDGTEASSSGMPYRLHLPQSKHARNARLMALALKTVNDAAKAMGKAAGRQVSIPHDECWRDLAGWALRVEEARQERDGMKAEDALTYAINEWVKSGAAAHVGFDPSMMSKAPDRYFSKEAIAARDAKHGKKPQ